MCVCVRVCVRVFKSYAVRGWRQEGREIKLEKERKSEGARERAKEGEKQRERNREGEEGEKERERDN